LPRATASLQRNTAARITGSGGRHCWQNVSATRQTITATSKVTATWNDGDCRTWKSVQLLLVAMKDENCGHVAICAMPYMVWCTAFLRENEPSVYSHEVQARRPEINRTVHPWSDGCMCGADHSSTASCALCLVSEALLTRRSSPSNSKRNHTGLLTAEVLPSRNGVLLTHPPVHSDITNISR
jgi:hypothetical protein